MKNTILFLLASATLLFIACVNGEKQSSNTNLSAAEFAQKIKELPSAAIVDVRTEEEFSKGHLQNAKNINWNGNDFRNQVSQLDKSKPVFVYCLSGGRSASAARQMRADGFKEVYELSGGIMKWRAANLPEASAASAGMTKQQFAELTNSAKSVLVDFYADWCAPCKKMKPYLDEIAKDMSDKVTVIRINADDNQQLCKELNVDALPVLQLYKNKTLAWTMSGYVGKEEVLKQIQ